MNLVADLVEVWHRCSLPNWDGQEAQPVQAETVVKTYSVIDSIIPLGLPLPCIGAEPNGCLTLKLHKEPNRTLSVSVNSDGTLNYVALLEGNNISGEEEVDGRFPRTILALIHRHFCE